MKKSRYTEEQVAYEPRWRSDGREIYYLSSDRQLMAVPVSPGPSFGLPKPLFQTHVPPGVIATRTHYVPSRDGQRFLINTAVESPAPSITVVRNWTAVLKKSLGRASDYGSRRRSAAMNR